LNPCMMRSKHDIVCLIAFGNNMRMN